MDFRNCQTATATPAEPGGFPFGLTWRCRHSGKMNSLKAFAVYSKGTPLARALRNQKHGAMLFAHHLDDQNEEVVLVLPAGSVRSFFMRSGRGMELLCRTRTVGLCRRVRECETVRAAVLSEAGRVLNVLPGDVLNQPFDRLKTIAKREEVQRNAVGFAKAHTGPLAGYSR